MRIAALFAAGLGACSGGTKDTDVVDTDTVADTDTGNDTGTVDCETLSPGSGARCALLERVGVGTATPGKAPTGYTGTESLVFTADFGEADELCRITYDLASTAVRDDCPGTCSWAFDLTTSKARIDLDVAGACAAVLDAVGVSELSDLEGQTIGRGYDPDFEGHAKVLMVYNIGTSAWQVASFMLFDDVSGSAEYAWADGDYAY